MLFTKSLIQGYEVTLCKTLASRLLCSKLLTTIQNKKKDFQSLGSPAVMGLPENRLVWLHTSLWRHEKLTTKTTYNSLCVCVCGILMVFLMQLATMKKNSF